MNKTEAVQKYWEEFCRQNADVNSAEPFQVWYFGRGREDSEELSSLVLQGKKTATASLPWEYDEKPEDMPTVGIYSVVTNFDGAPKCVVRTTEVRVVPFNEVDAEFAFDEGEGDQSLDYWREVHWDYFSRRCAEAGREPDTEMPIICERFELLYSKKINKPVLVENFWREFCAANPEINSNAPYEVWHFHHQREGAKKLAELVLAGKKRATASLMEYESDTGDGGIVGGYSVVTDFDGNPQCVIETTEVRSTIFSEVDAQFAFDEGEGDQTLEYWRAAHRKFFTECCRDLNIEFDESMPVCCKRFKVLFPKL